MRKDTVVELSQVLPAELERLQMSSGLRYGSNQATVRLLVLNGLCIHPFIRRYTSWRYHFQISLH
jgi:hypothetical protein